MFVSQHKVQLCTMLVSQHRVQLCTMLVSQHRVQLRASNMNISNRNIQLNIQEVFSSLSSLLYISSKLPTVYCISKGGEKTITHSKWFVFYSAEMYINKKENIYASIQRNPELEVHNSVNQLLSCTAS